MTGPAEQTLLEKLFSLKGRTALVTGAGSGIGRAMAGHLNAAGAAVVYASLPSEEAQLAETVEQARSEGYRADYETCDVTDTDGLAAFAEGVRGKFGAPDILVNAAGVNLRERWEDVTPESWRKTLDINLSAPFFLARELVPDMLKKKYGRIINIASLQAVRAFPNSMPYGASKGGVAQLTRAMAEGWSKDGQGVTANAIAPGFFKTALTGPLFDQEHVIEALAKQTIIGRNGEMADLAGLSIFLASPASDYITGQVFFLDGGWSAI